MTKTSWNPIATQAMKWANIGMIGQMPRVEAVKLKIIKICTEGPFFTLWRYPILNIMAGGPLVIEIRIG